ncbi:hypothetical protein LDENG_00244890 [Lucifuga dentata]|nr:hypothetical protein LDENG_00244890 [Lucifuga dentata]
MDKSIRTLLQLLSLLSIRTECVYGEGLALAPIELAPVPCNDKAVEKLSRLAVTYLNEDRTDGYKFALNRIANVHLHAQGPAGNVYYLDLEVLETKCHVGSPKPWKRCDVRPFMETQISGNCNTTVLHTTKGYSYLYSYDCTLVPDPPEKLQQTCPTCPLLLPVDSPEAVDAAQITLASFKRQSTLSADLGVKKITRAAAQVVPQKARFVEYTVQECPEGRTERGTCQRMTIASDTETAGFCTGSVHGDIDPDVQVSCEMFKAQNVDILRPVQPQGHDLPLEPEIPTFPPLIDAPAKDPQPVPSDPTLPPVAQPELPAPVDPTPVYVAPFDPLVAVNPSDPLMSSSSESAEMPDSSESSSEEVGGYIARRPPLNFRYQRHDRKKRQALQEAKPSHKPIFMSDFPSGLSPFRSCPGPARYTTV